MESHQSISRTRLQLPSHLTFAWIRWNITCSCFATRFRVRRQWTLEICPKPMRIRPTWRMWLFLSRTSSTFCPLSRRKFSSLRAIAASMHQLHQFGNHCLLPRRTFFTAIAPFCQIHSTTLSRVQRRLYPDPAYWTWSFCKTQAIWQVHSRGRKEWTFLVRRSGKAKLSSTFSRKCST